MVPDNHGKWPVSDVRRRGDSVPIRVLVADVPDVSDVLLGLQCRGPCGRASTDAFREKTRFGFDPGANFWRRLSLDV
jgi:hypothetical protein